MQRTRRLGSTLLLMLVAGFLLGLLAFSAVGLAGDVAPLTAGSDADMRYRCDAALEMLRRDVLAHHTRSGLPAERWLAALAEDHDGDEVTADWAALTSGADEPTTRGPVGSAPRGAAYDAVPGARAWIAAVHSGGAVELVAATAPGPDAEAEPLSLRLRVDVADGATSGYAAGGGAEPPGE